MAKELEPDDKAGEKLDDKSLAADAHIDEIGALNGDGFSRVISIPVIADAKDDARSSARPGVGPLLDIRAAVKESDTKDLSHEAAVVREQEAGVVIVFDLPDGSQVRARRGARADSFRSFNTPTFSPPSPPLSPAQGDQQFKMGQTVEVLKAFIAEEFSIPMETQQLFLGTKKMIDPMTLLDYPEIVPGGETVVRVEGDMDDSAKK